MRIGLSVVLLGLSLSISLAAEGAESASPGRFDVVWDSPSDGPSGSMPIGGGDLAANVWVESSGDLLLCVAKSDSFSGNGRILKLGQVRITFDPPLDTDTFRQELKLRDGEIAITAGEGDDRLDISVWFDTDLTAGRIEIGRAHV